MTRMVEALKTKSYDAFFTDVAGPMRAKLTRNIFESISDAYRARLQQGYKTIYVDKIRRRDSEMFVWKVEFADGGDESLIEVTIRDRKVVGFLIY